jgi:hypothetical protein
MQGAGKTPTTTRVYGDTCADVWDISEAVIYEYHINDPGVYTSAEFSFMSTYGHRQALYYAEQKS